MISAIQLNNSAKFEMDQANLFLQSESEINTQIFHMNILKTKKINKA